MPRCFCSLARCLPARRPQLRCPAVEASGALAKVLSREEVAATVMPAVVQCSQDKSWRVRYNAVQQASTRGPWLPCPALNLQPAASTVACGSHLGVRLTPRGLMIHRQLFLPFWLQLPALAEALGAETASSELLPLYLQLLRWVGLGGWHPLPCFLLLCQRHRCPSCFLHWLEGLPLFAARPPAGTTSPRCAPRPPASCPPLPASSPWQMSRRR